MKQVFLVLMIFLSVSLFAAAEKETVTITVLHGGNTPEVEGLLRYDYAAAKLKQDFPNAEVELLQVDLSDGSTLSMTALTAAGTPPNVYIDFIGRASKYITLAYALPLDGLVRDLGAYIDLKPYTRGGKVLALPDAAGAQGMAVNMEIMKEIGFTPTWDWTVADFLRMAALVKERYAGEKWATGMFAANQSGDYLINNWFGAFGVQYYADGYDRTTVDRGGAKVYEFFQLLAANEYIPPYAATLTDDDYVLQWAEGKLAATAFFPAWIKPYFDTVVTSGTGKPFEYQFFPFPGTKTPTYMMGAATVVYKTGTAADAIAARFAEYANDAAVQTALTLTRVIPTRTDATILIDDPRVAETGRIAAEHGIFDVGTTMEFFARTRPTHYPILQKVLTFELSPSEAIAAYAKAINAAIAE